MKTTLTILFLSLFHHNLIAQNAKRNKMRRAIRLEQYVGIPNSFGSTIQINIRNKYFFGIDALSILKPVDLPPDYHPLFVFENSKPEKEVSVLSVFIGKEFTETNNLSLNVSGGLGLVRQSTPFFKDIPARVPAFESLFVGFAYDISYQVKNSIGIMLVTEQEWKISKAVGLNLSLHANLNPIRSFVLLNSGVSFDLFRKKVREHKI